MEQEDDEKKLKRGANSYLKYSSLGLQLLFTILIAGWLGYKVDEYFAFKFPAFMLLLGFAAFAGFLYQLYRKIKKE